MTENVVPIKAEMVEARVEQIDPETAAQWLHQNKRNRNVRKRLVSTYARDMSAGRWVLTGEAIKFGTDGVLMDGQHRLLAIVEADATVSMLVLRGLDPESQLAMDGGAKRTAGDQLGLANEALPKTLASVALLVITNGGANRRTVSSAEIIEVVRKNPSIGTATEVASALRIAGLPQSILGYVIWRTTRVDPAGSARFFESLASLQGLPAGSPILALHRRLVTMSGEKRARSHLYRQELVCCVFHAWNAWQRGEQRQMIKFSYTSDGRIAIPKLEEPKGRVKSA